MRDIKFRVWDCEEKEMLYPGSNATELNSIMDCAITFDDVGCEVAVRYYGEDNYLTKTKFELMQYTGRKDKNGKEIYEGDIVRDKDGRILEVFWNSIGVGGWWFCELKDGDKMHAEKIDLDSLKVIGNIYENPKLLEAR
jgi:uncharacterized phage protein (TIGR01671 family)